MQPLTENPSIVLLDTIGELSALWGLADLAYVGGSLDGKRGGQNMIETAAYGTAVVFGPHVNAERCLRRPPQTMSLPDSREWNERDERYSDATGAFRQDSVPEKDRNVDGQTEL